MPRVTANGIEFYYEDIGEGLPLVLQAHHHITWMPFQVPYFSQFFRVITFDRRGTGRSEAPPEEWTNADFADDLAGLLDALEIDKAIVAGASLGGVIACQFGLSYPERARALVIGHTTPYFRAESKLWVDEQIKIIEEGGRPIFYQPPSFPWQEHGPPTQRPGFADSELGQYLGTLDAGLGATKTAAIQALRAIREWDCRPAAGQMAEWTMPCLVLVGGNESQKTQTLSYEWHKMIPDSEFIILPNSHHGAARENPIVWNQTVHDFLKRHGLGGGAAGDSLGSQA